MLRLGETELTSYRHQGVLWPCRGRSPERFVLVWPPNKTNPHPQKKYHFRVCDNDDMCVSTGNSKEENQVQLNLLVY